MELTFIPKLPDGLEQKPSNGPNPAIVQYDSITHMNLIMYKHTIVGIYLKKPVQNSVTISKKS